jgi:hypothetical protein
MKLETGNWKLAVALCLCALCGDSMAREIAEKWKVSDEPQNTPMDVGFYQAENVTFELTALQGREPFDLTGQSVLWEVVKWSDTELVYVATTGTVIDAEAGICRFELSPEQTNIDDDIYRGFIRAMSGDGTAQTVLAMQRIEVEWSPAAGLYPPVEVRTDYYTATETDILLAAIRASNAATSNELAAAVSEVSDQTSAVSGRVTAVEGRLTDVESDKQDASTAATDAELSAAVSDAPNWTAAYAWGNHALAGYLTSYTETDPLFAAWDRSYDDLTDKPTIPTQYSDAMAEAALADELADKAGLTDFQTLETDHAALSNLWENTDATVQTLETALGSAPLSYTFNHPSYGMTTVYFSSFDSDGRPSYYYAQSDPIRYVVLEYGSGAWSVRSSGTVDEEGDTYVVTNSMLPPTGDWLVDIFGDWLPVDIGMTAGTGLVYSVVETLAGTATAADLTTVSDKVDDLEDGSEDFEAVNLNGDAITDWDDALTVVDGLPLNAPITITNDSSWTGWTVGGDMTASNTIYLTIGETLTSPVQTNGIADYEVTDNSGWTISISAMVGSNTVSVPYYGADAQLVIECPSQIGVPGLITANNIEKVILTGYEDRAEASEKKYISGACRIEREVDDCDLTRKIYVDEQRDAAKSYSDTKLATYAANEDKTVVCARLRIGEDYELVGDGGASGDIWAINGCQLNGGGELVATATGLGINRNGRQLLSFRDYASGLYINSFNASAWTVDVATNGVEATPFLEWSPSMIAQDWQTIPDSGVLSGSVYTFTVSSPPTNDTVFVRAMQPVGTSAVLVDAEVLILNDSNGDAWAISIDTAGNLITTKE